MGDLLLKHGDIIELPEKLPSGEEIIYDDGPKQPIEAKLGKKTNCNGNLIVVKEDLLPSKFKAPCSYKIMEKQNGKGIVTIEVPTVKVTAKQKLNGHPMVLIKGKFKVKLSKAPPAVAPPPANTPDPVLIAMGDAQFSQAAKSNVKGI